MKISFDFDFTLSRKDVQLFAKMLVDGEMDVWIVTSRRSDAKLKEDNIKWNDEFVTNDDLFLVANEIGIPKEKIIFTNHEFKWLWFINNPDFAVHLDDNHIELNLINKFTKVKGISVEGTSSWKHKIKKFLK